MSVDGGYWRSVAFRPRRYTVFHSMREAANRNRTNHRYKSQTHHHKFVEQTTSFPPSAANVPEPGVAAYDLVHEGSLRLCLVASMICRFADLTVAVENINMNRWQKSPNIQKHLRKNKATISGPGDPLPWALSTKLIASVSVAVGIALHFFGHIAHDTYLNAWGIDSGQFPKSIQWMGVNGFVAVSDRITTLLKLLTSDWHLSFYLVIIIIFSLIYVDFLNFISGWEPKGAKKHSTVRGPIWLYKLILNSAYAVVIPLLALFVLIIIGSIMAIILLIGSSHGSDRASNDLAQFKKGCRGDGVKRVCVQIRKNNLQIVEGFIIDSTESRIAIFDNLTKQVRVVELSGAELVADSPK